MKIIIAGGSGYLGNILAQFYKTKAHEVIILSRNSSAATGNVRTVQWDGKTTGVWVNELEGADMLVNLAGKNVNCRYTEKNKKEILESRLNATRVLGEAIQGLRTPPALWIQSSSATIYRYSEDKMMTEEDGQRGMGFSEMVCQRWEKLFTEIDVPRTRKVILRTGIVLGRKDGALPRLVNLVKLGLGGKQGHGRQYVSWIHERDFVSLVEWVRVHPVVTGIFNGTAPQPVMNKNFMAQLRHEFRMSFGLPAQRWLLGLGALIIGTETELILKSRKVYPQRLLDNGFVFEFPDLKSALVDLCQQEEIS
jgi:uncharacterized protein (TIGR01777 family)